MRYANFFSLKKYFKENSECFLKINNIHSIFHKKNV